VGTPLFDTSDRLQAALAGRYRLERELGHGGMANVYLAHDLRHDRPVALKVVRPELAAVLGPERFLREIKFAARLQHQHILPVHDSGEAASLLWYTAPYMEGGSLRDRIGREVQLPVEEARRIASEIAAALAHAHAHGVIHRDIKPENVLLTDDGHVVVADFGIAKALSAAGGERLTETGLALGTPAYMSPEQAAGGEVDGRTDLYSLGCVLYEMLVGQTPHTGPSAQAIIARRMAEPPPRIRTVRDAVPATLEAVVLQALARVPADRFATAEDLISALARAGAGGPVPEGRTRRMRQLLTVVVALGALGVGGSMLLRPRLAAPALDRRVVAVLPFRVDRSEERRVGKECRSRWSPYH